MRRGRVVGFSEEEEALLLECDIVPSRPCLFRRAAANHLMHQRSEPNVCHADMSGMAGHSEHETAARCPWKVWLAYDRKGTLTAGMLDRRVQVSVRALHKGRIVDLVLELPDPGYLFFLASALWPADCHSWITSSSASLTDCRFEGGEAQLQC